MLPETVTKPVEIFARDAQKNGKKLGVKALRSSASTLSVTARYLEQLASKWETVEPVAERAEEQVAAAAEPSGAFIGEQPEETEAVTEEAAE